MVDLFLPTSSACLNVFQQNRFDDKNCTVSLHTVDRIDLIKEIVERNMLSYLLAKVNKLNGQLLHITYLKSVQIVSVRCVQE